MVGKNWRDFFDVVIVQADKPHFFTDCIKWVTPCSLSVWRMCAGILLMRWGAVISVLLFNNLQNCCSYRPFRRLDGNGDLRWEKIKSLDKGQIYKQVCNEKNVHWPLWHLIYLSAVVFTHWKVCMFLLVVFWVSNECMWLILLFQGNLFDFLRLTGWRGSKVLYFGDHLYSDLAVSIRARWSHHDELPSQCSAWWLTFCGIGISRNFPVWLHLTSLVCDLAKWDFFFFFFLALMVHIIWKIYKYRVCAEMRTVPDAICLHVLHDSESPESIWVGSEQTVQWKSETLDGSMSATIFRQKLRTVLCYCAK